MLLQGTPGLRAMEPLKITVRDGTQVLCYLTLGSTQSGSTPLVVIPHGGPSDRDSWGFCCVTQWLASRGMSVLNVNFRGSTGFGHRFFRAGMQGKFASVDPSVATMQTDIDDAVRWVASNRPIDRERLAIYGGSWGGLSALHAMTNPEGVEYCCAIGVVPVTSVGCAGVLGFRGDPLIQMYWDDVFGEVSCPQLLKVVLSWTQLSHEEATQSAEFNVFNAGQKHVGMTRGATCPSVGAGMMIAGRGTNS